MVGVCGGGKRERQIERGVCGVWVSVCVRERVRERCVCEREREREREVCVLLCE